MSTVISKSPKRMTWVLLFLLSVGSAFFNFVGCAATAPIQGTLEIEDSTEFLIIQQRGGEVLFRVAFGALPPSLQPIYDADPSGIETDVFMGIAELDGGFIASGFPETRALGKGREVISTEFELVSDLRTLPVQEERYVIATFSSRPSRHVYSRFRLLMTDTRE